MSKIDYGQNCPLVQYLLKVSCVEDSSLKVRFAGALSYLLGHPHFDTLNSNVTILIALQLETIYESGQTRLIFEAAQKCAHCPYSGSCPIEPLFKGDLMNKS